MHAYRTHTCAALDADAVGHADADPDGHPDADADRDAHAGSETFHRAPPPDAVAWPLSTAEVSAVLKICNEHLVPVVGWGAGTSLEGHALAVRGGLTLDLTRMNRVIEVRAGDLLLTIEAMKMEASISATKDGVVERVAIGQATKVEGGDLIAVIN